MVGAIKVLGSAGHATIPYDTEAPETIEAALAEWEKQVKAGMSPWDTSDPEHAVPLDYREDFDPAAHESVTFTPWTMGG